MGLSLRPSGAGDLELPVRAGAKERAAWAEYSGDTHTNFMFTTTVNKTTATRGYSALTYTRHHTRSTWIS